MLSSLEIAILRDNWHTAYWCYGYPPFAKGVENLSELPLDAEGPIEPEVKRKIEEVKKLLGEK